LDYAGIVNAIKKAHKIAEALTRFTVSSEFWAWYKMEILGKVKTYDDRRTYRQIFTEIEDAYFSGKHKNTGETRTRDNPSFFKSYKRTYLLYFDKFPNWDKLPDWKDFEVVLFSWKQGTKTFRDCYFVLKKIAKLCDRATSLEVLDKLSKIDPIQTEFKEKQFILWDEFIDWMNTQRQTEKRTERDEQSKDQWLWVTGMIAMYGLRPTEISAALNLDKPYRKDGVTIPAINDPDNELKLLVIGSHTPWGGTIALRASQKSEVRSQK
jgi:hypothetical protein